MGALREVLARFGFEVDGTDKLKAADKGISGLEKKLTGLGSALAGAAIVQGFRGIVSELVDTASQLDDTSQRLGLNAQELQQWQFAAKLSGVEAGAFSASVKKLQLNMAEATANGAKTGGTFKELGISLRESNGDVRPALDVMRDLGEAVSTISDPAKRTETLVKTLGKAGSDLAPMFANGAEGLESLLGELDKAGGGLTQDAIDQLAELGDNGDRFEMSLLSLKGALAKSVLPWLNKAVSSFSQWIGTVSKSESAMGALKIALGGVAAVGAAMAVSLIAPFIPMALVIGGIALAVDELIVGMRGGKTVIGDFLDAVGGEGTSKEFFEWLKEALQDIKEFANDVLGAIKQIKGLSDDFKSGKAKTAITRDLQKMASSPDSPGALLAAPVAGFLGIQKQTEKDKQLEAMGEAGGAEKRRLQAEVALEKSDAIMQFLEKGENPTATLGSQMQERAFKSAVKEVFIQQEMLAPGTGQQAVKGAFGSAGQDVFSGEMITDFFSPQLDKLGELTATMQDLKAQNDAQSKEEAGPVNITMNTTNNITTDGSAEENADAVGTATQTAANILIAKGKARFGGAK